jgi:hypothetical protein
MNRARFFTGVLLIVLVCALTSGCGREEREPRAREKLSKHEHHPLHGGTAVVLGDEVYHLELVRGADAGKLQAYVFDGDLENFIRSSDLSIEIDASVNGAPQILVLVAIANPATGETVGDTSLFEAQADWLKTTGDFDATLKGITIRGSQFTNVKFNFPKGTDSD